MDEIWSDQSISPALNYVAPSLGSLEDRRGYCYDFISFPYTVLSPLFFDLTLSFTYISLDPFFLHLITHACLLMHLCLLIQLLICLLMCLLRTHAQDAYSCVLRLLMHSLIVQYIRTGWTLLFGS